MTSDILNVFGLPTLVNTFIGRTTVRRSTNQKYQFKQLQHPFPRTRELFNTGRLAELH